MKRGSGGARGRLGTPGFCPDQCQLATRGRTQQPRELQHTHIHICVHVQTHTLASASRKQDSPAWKNATEKKDLSRAHLLGREGGRWRDTEGL